MNGPELKQLRRLAGLTQEEMAHRLEVTHRTVLRWEHGETQIASLTAEGIRAVLLRTVFGQSKRNEGEV